MIKRGKLRTKQKNLHSSHKAQTSVLLKTTFALVWSENSDANIVFDEGVQWLFITEDIAMKLEFKQHRIHTTVTQ